MVSVFRCRNSYFLVIGFADQWSLAKLEIKHVLKVLRLVNSHDQCEASGYRLLCPVITPPLPQRRDFRHSLGGVETIWRANRAESAGEFEGGTVGSPPLWAFFLLFWAFLCVIFEATWAKLQKLFIATTIYLISSSLVAISRYVNRLNRQGSRNIVFLRNIIYSYLWLYIWKENMTLFFIFTFSWKYTL